jgi:hypothetical protein
LLKGSDARSTFLFAALAFLALNFAFLIDGTRLAKEKQADKLVNHDKKLGSWWLAKAYVDRKKCPEIVLLGSSQMGAFQFADAQFFKRTVDYTGDRSADYLAYELKKKLGIKADAFVAAMPGALISDDFLIVRALCEGDPSPKLFILGISPRDLIDNNCPSVMGTEPFEYFSHAARLDDCIDLYCPKFWDKANWTLKQTAQLPDLRGSAEEFAFAAHQFFAPEKGAKAMRDIGQAPLFQKIEPGQLVLKPDENPVFTDNTDEYAGRYKNPFPTGLNKQLVFLAKLLNYAKERGIRVMVVGMPLTAQNQALLPDKFWNFYRHQIASISLETGAHWIDLASCPTFQHGDYSDCVHLNGFGGMKLCEVIAHEVSKYTDVVEALKIESPNQLKISQK